MKTIRVALALALLTAGLAASESALAHRSRVSIGFHFGVPLGWAYTHPYPYYYYPPVYVPTVVVPAQPQTYIERPAPQQPAQGWWHYCADSRAYYPYVKDCPGGWQRVAPQPSN